MWRRGPPEHLPPANERTGLDDVGAVVVVDDAPPPDVDPDGRERERGGL